MTSPEAEQAASESAENASEEAQRAEELAAVLVEEVSIDGMCGVY